MNTRQYQYILSAAETRNFGLAAEKCSITQSTLSTMIGRFEAEIDIKIFDRSTKPITITKEGEQIIDQIKIIEKEIFNLWELTQSIKGELTGEVKMGVIPTIAPYLLPDFLSDFTQEMSHMKLIVNEIATEHIIDLLVRRELDVGIVALPIHHNTLEEMPLYNEPFVLYDCTGKKSRKIKNLESIDYSRFWLLKEGHCLHNQVRTLCEIKSSQGYESSNLEFRAGSIESLIRFVRKNQGTTLLPHLACLDFPARDSKSLNYFCSPVPVRTVGLLYHRHFAKKQLLEKIQGTILKNVTPRLVASKREMVLPPFLKTSS